MSAIKTFFQLIFNSATSLSFYKQLGRVSFKTSVTMYLGFLLLLAIFNSFWFWLITAPKLEQQIQQSIVQLTNSFPETLVVEWTGSELQSSSSPVIFAMPAAAPAIISSLADNLVVINTDDSPTDQTALLTLNQTSVFLQVGDQTGQPTDLSLFLHQPISIDNQTLPAQKQQLQQSLTDLVQTAKLVHLPVYLLVIALTRAVMLLFETSIIFVLFRLNKIANNFAQLLQLSMHLFIPAELVHQVALRIIPDFPVSLHSLSFWILFLTVFFSTQLSPKQLQRHK